MWKGPFPWGKSVSYTGALTIPWGWQMLGGESWSLYRETEGLWFKKKKYSVLPRERKGNGQKLLAAPRLLSWDGLGQS